MSTHMKRHNAEPEAPKGFDKVVTHRDPKTGLVVRTNPYVMRKFGKRQKVFERPVGSGNCFNAKGEPVGRWDATKPEGEQFLAGAKHIEWTAPETNDQRLAKTLGEKDAQIAALKRELAQIEAEKSGAGKKDRGA